MNLVTDEDVTKFLSSDPAARDISKLKKVELKLVASKLDIAFSPDTKKDELRRLVQTILVPEEMDALDGDPDTSCEIPDGGAVGVGPPNLSTSPDREILMLQLQLQRERAQQEAEREMRKQEAEREMRQQEMEMRKMELEAERERREHERQRWQTDNTEARIGDTHQPRPFDITKHVRVVPAFDEDDPTEYFHSFERIAKNME